MLMSDEKVSIITPLYNSSEFLKETVESVLKQNYQNWEMIIVDDCSTDNSLQIAQQYAAQDKRIQAHRLPENSGAAVARNKAIELASGRFIAFLDADDIWLPNKLEKQIAFMLRSNVSFSYSAYEKINEQGETCGLVGVPAKVSYKELLKTCYIGCLTAVYDTQFFGKVFMPLIRKRQDFGLWLKLLKKVDYAFAITEPLAKYRLRRDSISANKANAATYTWRLYREVEKLSLLQSFYFFSHYAVRGVLRKKTPTLAKRLGVLH